MAPAVTWVNLVDKINLIFSPHVQDCIKILNCANVPLCGRNLDNNFSKFLFLLSVDDSSTTWPVCLILSHHKPQEGNSCHTRAENSFSYIF